MDDGNVSLICVFSYTPGGIWYNYEDERLYFNVIENTIPSKCKLIPENHILGNSVSFQILQFFFSAAKHKHVKHLLRPTTVMSSSFLS